MIEFFKALSQRASIAVMTLNALRIEGDAPQLNPLWITGCGSVCDDQELVVYHNQLASKIFGGKNHWLVCLSRPL